MSPRIRYNAVHWYMNDLTSKIVAESGVSTDIYHLGKIIFYSMRSDPDLILHIDGVTSESETFGAALKRTVHCARAFKEIGLKTGDVIVLMAPNHLDAAIPLYAALYLGIATAPIHEGCSVSELEDTLRITEPKAIFCQSNKIKDVQQVLGDLSLNSKVVPFDKGSHECFPDFLETYGKGQTVEEFRAADFDPEETIAFLISTSGSTGLPKKAMLTHKNLVITGPNLWIRSTKFPTPTRMALVSAPLQWVSALVTYIMSPYMKYPRIQSSQPCTLDHFCYLMNTYKPSFAILSPTVMISLMKSENGAKCDFSCLTELFIGGSAVSKDLIDDIKKIIPNAFVKNLYGLSETAMMVFEDDVVPPGSIGLRMPCFEYKLVDADRNEILVPNVPGELYLRGPGVFKGYYRNPEMTQEAFDGDWFKTGDMFYRDENWYYFFVERIKSLLKYKSFQISPVELEMLIRQHPGVQDVAVTGIEDPECGDLPVALVVPKPGTKVDAQEIKDLVKEKLIDAKQLRGGVVFLEGLPLTKTTKLDRKKLKELVLEMKRE
ncbi:luciferin 4-monooxygenase [Manduca sexta]|uniref:Luciferin 4-monooxygenase n=1 Tax=Manduca sexta TaxID=7130 RepID=A0A921ZGG4_MANSE|nr:luciferin 4-monooxygenase [Manduca sexta]KAG6456347.1 hypothetical protein O3G_MSEX009681 [Manduca sexta]